MLKWRRRRINFPISSQHHCNILFVNVKLFSDLLSSQRHTMEWKFHSHRIVWKKDIRNIFVCYRSRRVFRSYSPFIHDQQSSRRVVCGTIKKHIFTSTIVPINFSSFLHPNNNDKDVENEDKIDEFSPLFSLFTHTSSSLFSSSLCFGDFECKFMKGNGMLCEGRWKIFKRGENNFPSTTRKCCVFCR
jgi:hypothetical protein